MPQPDQGLDCADDFSPISATPTSPTTPRQISTTSEQETTGPEKNDNSWMESSDTPGQGVLSAGAAHALVKGLVDLDILVKKISVSTGLKPQEIIHERDNILIYLLRKLFCDTINT